MSMKSWRFMSWRLMFFVVVLATFLFTELMQLFCAIAVGIFTEFVIRSLWPNPVVLPSPSGPIHVGCPKCRTVHEILPEFIGEVFKCHRCHNWLFVCCHDCAVNGLAAVLKLGTTAAPAPDGIQDGNVIEWKENKQDMVGKWKQTLERQKQHDEQQSPEANMGAGA